MIPQPVREIAVNVLLRLAGGTFFQSLDIARQGTPGARWQGAVPSQLWEPGLTKIQEPHKISPPS